MLRRSLLSNSGGGVLPSEAEACQVVYANKQTLQLTIDDLDTDKYTALLYEPIGIVVIPGHHGVLKDSNGKNQCGIISIVAMNCDTPETGGSESSKIESIDWGDNKTDISSMTNYNKVVVTTDNTSNTASGLSKSPDAHIPYQNSIGGIPERKRSYYAPSPYIGSDYKSGGYNESYGTTIYDTETDHNVLADFDGRGNTDKILTQRGLKDYNSWKPKDNNSLDYPAASCCDMFFTIGTKQGDWYLPAAGELGYIIPRLYDINDIISKLNNAYGVGVELITGLHYYWTSSECNSSNAYHLNMYAGNVETYHKTSPGRARAFLRL